MSDVATLSDAVEAINDQAERKKSAENTDEKVATAKGAISSLNEDIEDLSEAVDILQFYRQLLDEMFPGDEPPNVQPALEKAESAVQMEQSEIVDALIETANEGAEDPINEYRGSVTKATSSVNNATDVVKERLRGYKNEWEERLSSARDLQDIIGGQNDDFARTVDWMEDIITSNMWEPKRNASSVITNWENAKNQWENHQDLQGLDAFQETHGLSDDAVAAVERLSSHSNLTLDEVDVDVLNELKNIDRLADAVELSI